jgi:antitoxin PrlF
MKVAESRVTAQGQISVPAEVRRRLGLAPGAILEWDAEGETIIVRRARRYTSTDIHKALFPGGPPPPHSLEELKEGIRSYMKERHARR